MIALLTGFVVVLAVVVALLFWAITIQERRIAQCEQQDADFLAGLEATKRVRAEISESLSYLGGSDRGRQRPARH